MLASLKQFFVLSMIPICWLAFVTQVTTVAGQQSSDVPVLHLNQSLSGSLKSNESRMYQLHAEAGMLVRVEVMQQGVDVAVRAFDAQKNRVGRYDDSFGRVGPQLLEFAAAKTADYFIEVLARPNELGGRYEIKYVEARPLTSQDRFRLAARSYLATGNTQRSKISPATVRAAMIEYAKALTLYKQINDQAGQAVVLYYMGRMFESQSDYRKALENFSAALPLWRAVLDRRREAYALSSIGTMHLYLSDLEKAYPAFVAAGAIHRELGNKEWEALAYQEIGNVHRQRGDMVTALTWFQKALPIFKEVGANTRMIYLLSNIGAAHEGLGDLQQAATYQKQALDLGREFKQAHGISLALLYLGDIYAQRGETRQALSFYQQALPACLELGDDNCAGRSYRRLASVYDSLGEAQTALDYYAKGAAIYRLKERPVELARVLNSAGALYSSLGDKARSLDLHSEALVVSRKAQSRQDEAESLANLADLYREGQAQRARDYYLQALTISREIKNRQSEASNLNRLGLLANSTGNNPEAIKNFEQALAINNELGAKPNGAVTLNNLGVVYDRSGEAKLALDYFSKSLVLFREIENKHGEAMMLYRVATARKKLGQLSEARNEIKAALEIVETIRGKIASTDLRASYFATVQQYYDLYIELLMREHLQHPELGADFSALQVSEQARARSLLDLLQEAGADVRNNVDAKLLDREKELVELINGKAAQQALAFADPKKAELAKTLGEEIGRLEIEYETLQSEIRQSNPRYAELVRAAPPSLAEMQGLLDDHTVLLEYKLADEHSHLWVVSPTKFESYQLPARRDIEDAARLFYQLVTERNRTFKTETLAQRQTRIQLADKKLEAFAGALREILLGQVSSLTTGKRLVIIGDGALQYLPFGAIAGSANEIVSLPSIAVLGQLRRENRPRTPAKSIAVFADPVFESDDPRLPARFRKRVVRRDSVLAQSQTDFDFGENGSGLPRLLASREEANAILALAPPASSFGALDFDANRERAMNGDLSQYRVLHFATHALLNHARPQLSGVVLSLIDEQGRERDGFLRLNQIYKLRLSSELVVLSACSTALGKDVRGEGLVGLTRGFMYAGAPRVIASLWKVDDEATGELMKIFYAGLLQKRLSPSQALKAAQLEMQSRTRWRSPYYWAAFTLQGDWR